MPVTPTDEARRLEQFWNSRYLEFSLRESGIKTLTPAYSELLYRCKKAAYMKALAMGAISSKQAISILDGGCGQGFFAAVAQESFSSPKYTGIDISEKAISFLKTKFPQFRWVCADLCDKGLKLPPMFNIVQSIEVLHLVLDDINHSQALCNLACSVAPGGILVTTDTLPQQHHHANEYIVFRPGQYYWNLLADLKMKVLGVFPMYYWIPDMGLASHRLSGCFRRIPPAWVYYSDRLFLKLRIPQFRQTHDSRMKMIVCQKAS